MLHPFLDNSIRWLDKIEGHFLCRRAKRHLNWHMAMTDTAKKDRGDGMVGRPVGL
jgi:hypothetical protein